LPKSGTPEYADWRINGTVPEPKAKPKADAAPAQDSTKVDSGEATAPEQQEHTERQTRRKPDAEARIRQLADDLKRTKAELEEARKPRTTADSSTAKPQQPQYTRPKPVVDDKTADGKPKYATYEDYVEELADWKAEQRMVAAERQRAEDAMRRELSAKVEDARTRYGKDKLDQVLFPTSNVITSDPQISPAVKAMINDSDVLPDLLFTLGSDATGLSAFVQMAKTNTGKALRYIARVEGLIEDELAKTTTQRESAAAHNENGQFAKLSESTPAQRKPESVTDLPLEVGNRGTGTMDESSRALSAIERGDSNAVRAFLKAENAKDLRRRRGA
jgi:hypothetical protein